ncbi:hypothetical protein [Martelella limonii]|uniref:hypothetical protein n=1 Tax=Martelella limonii TaxID=1647649 RepID=UPI001580145D|nr:hypothetical protein [Martelella limonii]
MGMFDYIVCEADLPKTAIDPPCGPFQTKDTPDQYLTVYTITTDGRLTWRPYRMLEVPKEERPYPDGDEFLVVCGSLRREENDPEQVNFHGDIEFYTDDEDHGGWWKYRAHFNDGKLASIDLVKFEAPNYETPPRL